MSEEQSFPTPSTVPPARSYLHSCELYVSDIGAYPIQETSPSTQARFDEVQNISRVIYNACEAQSTPQGILNFLRSEDLASDWNSVRAALGYNTTHLLGLS